MSSKPPQQVLLDFNTFHNVIDGQLTSTPEHHCSTNPSTLEANPPAPVSTIDDVNKAVNAARRAFRQWSQVPWDQRKQHIENFAQALEANAEGFAAMIVKEQGKPLSTAQYEISTGVQWLRGFCKLSIPEEVIEQSEQRKVSTRYTPIGVGVGIIPWNYPVQPLAIGKIGPALLMGNVLILKPSTFTPYCALKLAELGTRCFPPGVLQALAGDDALGPWLTEHPGVDKVSLVWKD
ncbi:Aldehyde/histidinol dehydrogenase [Xylariomycetidae sp. FL2044]|nr:Aldehyde/histidinol dehydrogenase [Xylariomycetidae sp. FL2044]